MFIDLAYLGVLCLWILAVILLVFTAWRGKYPVAGLGLGYLALLWLNHGLAGFLQLLPWHVSEQRPVTIIGFKITGFAIAGLLIGYYLVVPLIRPYLGLASSSHSPRRGATGLPFRFICVGLFCFLILIFPWTHLPSIAAVLAGGLSLAVAGFCLLWWSDYQSRHTLMSKRSFFLILIIPISILLTHGFLGYGVVSLMTFGSFVAVYYRPRLTVVVVGMGCLILGLTFFPAYMRARNQIRRAVWGEAGLEERISTTYGSIVEHWEWYDPEDPNFFQPFEARLNQNYVLGRSVLYLKGGGAYFARGETLLNAFIALVPRVLWRDKPEFAGSANLVPRFTGLPKSNSTSFGIGHIMELYVNFAEPGVLLGFIILGTGFGIADLVCGYFLRKGKWSAFALWFSVALAFHNVIGNFAESTAGAVGGVILWFVVAKAFTPGAAAESVVPRSSLPAQRS